VKHLIEKNNHTRYDFLMTGEVKRFPTAFLCMGLVLLASQVLAFGFLVHSVRRGRVEVKRRAYLAQKGHVSQNAKML
jgi:hypothetical protein